MLLWTGPVFLCGILGVIFSGWSSHRTGERKWHCVSAQVATGIFLALSALPETRPFGSFLRRRSSGINRSM